METKFEYPKLQETHEYPNLKEAQQIKEDELKAIKGGCLVCTTCAKNQTGANPSEQM